MFKIGDKVVCVSGIKTNKGNLENYKEYIISYISDDSFQSCLKVEGIEFGFLNSRFITLKEYRKNKLNNLLKK